MVDLLYTENNASEVMALLSSASHPRMNGATQQLKTIHYMDSQRYHCASPGTIQPPKPFASRCLEYFRTYTVDVIRSSLGQTTQGRPRIFPSVRQLYRWVLLLLLLIIDVQEEAELSEPPQFFTRPEASLPVHRPVQSREKTSMESPSRNLLFHPPKDEVDSYCKDNHHGGANHNSTYDALIAETDSLAIELKDDSLTEDFSNTMLVAQGSAELNACLPQSGNIDSSTRPPSQIPRFPCLSPKPSVRTVDNHAVPNHALPTFHNNADQGRCKAEARMNLLNSPPHGKSTHLLHKSSSPELRRQKSPVHMDADVLRHDNPKEHDSTNTTSSSNSSSSGKRPSIPRGSGVQLIQGKTIGEILHANPLIRKDDTSLVLAPWRS
ncbi:hypothetical protein K450DRAFT_224974 [Umbelopsis ramanniana AG]|uniref:Uncharacterized protein n=1 Tax=Umbelopsis ramanniana AG TaxID=1314678 RepID=A0AAD5EH46_UMBRA|nr:uncharacterized protein K450DRAFT_224974 [Umbelopsis ramanniana AG]KAI8582821.1 hypothetical protein K450DRAFT_224974 [Umbelopsis ramanniana AG]